MQVLSEETEAAGREIDDPPDDAADTWSEEQIRQHFGGQNISTTCVGAASDAEGGRSVLRPRISFPEPSELEFKTLFPGFSKTTCSDPRLRVLCFCNAGSAEDMFTSEGSGARRAVSPLLEWCRAHSAECLAVQPPGRNMRIKEKPLTSAVDLANLLLPVVANRLVSVPYVVIAHSVGTWVAYEFLQAVRQAGLPMPCHAFLSAMAAPDVPLQQRPWRQATLDEAEFKDECRSWDVNEIVFSAAMWSTYHSLMRADFQLFDEYIFLHQDHAALDIPLTTFHGASDRKISRDLVAGWQRFTGRGCSLETIDGNHLWPLQKPAKAEWLTRIACVLDTVLDQHSGHTLR